MLERVKPRRRYNVKMAKYLSEDSQKNNLNILKNILNSFL